MKPSAQVIYRTAKVQALLLWLLVCLALSAAAQEEILSATEAAKVKNLVASAEKNIQKSPDSAIYFFTKAREICQKAGATEEAAKLTVEIADVETLSSNPHKALKVLLAGLAVHEKAGNEKAIAYLSEAIGGVYERLQSIEGARDYELKHQVKLIEKAQQYYERALTIFTKHNNTKKRGDLAFGLGNLYLEKGEAGLAIAYYEQALQFFQQTNDETKTANLYANLSHLKLNTGHEKEGLKLINIALAHFQKTNNLSGQGIILNLLGAHYTTQKKQAQALPYYLRALELAKQAKDLSLHEAVAGNLYWAYKDLNNSARALEFYEHYSILNDSLYNLARAQQIAELQEKYETEKKQHQIEVLQKDKQLQQASISRRTWERNATIAGLLLTLVIAVLVIRNVRQRQKATALLAAKNEELNRNRIQELLRDQELASVHGILQGQEAERKRIAQDLHDRLGSLLATVKLHFQMAKTEEQRETAATLMDEACQEVRQIAHNMVSGVLMKFGLTAALNDLAQAINSTGKVHVQTIVHGLNHRLPGNSEVEIYRIVQELVSNALKHAGAKEITVQLHRHADLLNLMVEDDGTGFVPAKAKNKGGMGLKGVQSRVNQLKGELNIDSSPGRGTTILIDIPVEQPESFSSVTAPVMEVNHD